ILLLIQYVYSLELTERELPSYKTLKIIGFLVAETRSKAVATILIKTLLSLPLFVVLRLHLRERFYSSLSAAERVNRASYGTFPTGTGRSPRTAALSASPATAPPPSAPPGSWVGHYLGKYWIFLVSLVLLLISISSPPHFYT
uniref:Piezo TM1-24 domain-containing protein n=1 Tax=Plectus sambesii TaxID=2011161 RepID=A0A914ULA5_9BILA